MDVSAIGTAGRSSAVVRLGIKVYLHESLRAVRAKPLEGVFSSAHLSQIAASIRPSNVFQRTREIYRALRGEWSPAFDQRVARPATGYVFHDPTGE